MDSEMGLCSKLRRLPAAPICVMIRGELGIGGASSRRSLVCGRSVRILTMMQSCASAAKLRGGGPILSVGIGATVSRPLGSLIRQSAEKPALVERFQIVDMLWKDV